MPEDTGDRLGRRRVKTLLHWPMRDEPSGCSFQVEGVELASEDLLDHLGVEWVVLWD